MAILCYLKPINGLPDQKGSLSSKDGKLPLRGYQMTTAVLLMGSEYLVWVFHGSLEQTSISSTTPLHTVIVRDTKGSVCASNTSIHALKIL